MHSHSNFSDGIYSPKELLKQAQNERLVLYSITDHDTIEGTMIAEKLATKFPFAYLNGIEISARYENTKIEILGYNFTTTNSSLSNKMHFLQQKRKERIFKILTKLQELGLNITYEDILNQVGSGSSPGRPHLARAMIEKKIVRDINEAFEKYIGNGRPAYVRRETITPKTAIDLIRSGKGTAVLPHPLLVEAENLNKLEYFLDLLVSWKLEGVELYYEYNHVIPFLSDSTISKGLEFLMKYCKKNDLLLTGGSDYHGDTGELGSVSIPKDIIENILSYFDL